MLEQVGTMQHSHRTIEDEDGYDDLSRLIQANVARAEGPLFTTDATDLFDLFLAQLPPERRQHYTCRNCRQFIERFGNLVTITAGGVQVPLLWVLPEVPRFFSLAVNAPEAAVSQARVTGVFLSGDGVWGTPSNVSKMGVRWNHLHGQSGNIFRHALLTAGQAMAEKLEDHGMLSRGLAEFPLEMVKEAHRLLTAGGLYRSEKCIGVAKWLLDLHEALNATQNRRNRANLVWRAVATAPAGFCHVRSTMIGTLLEDIAAGLPFESIRRKFDEKLNPAIYQRPQSAPSDGQLAAAEAVVAKLASAGSLARRFATLDDLKGREIWLPKAPKEDAPADGVFGHLKSTAKPSSGVDISAQFITWEKFARTALPDAERIEMFVPHRAASFFAFVTAENLDAPPILQWDREGARNPVSWYQYVDGSLPSQWGLANNGYVDVVAIIPQPSQWCGQNEHQGDGAYFVLRGAKDTRSAGLALFPETLRSEYHGIRKSIEAYSNSRHLPECPNPAAGLCIQKSMRSMGVMLRVTSKGGRASFTVDRWD